MRTKEEVLQHMIDTFDEIYSQRINEEEEQFVSIEEFRRRGLEIITERFRKLENECSNSKFYI